MRKSTLFSAVALTVALVGCNTVYPTQTESPATPPTTEPIVIDTPETKEPEPEPTVEPSPEIEQGQDDEQNQPDNEEPGDFVEGEGTLLQSIIDKGGYEGTEKWNVYSIDMDKDGLDEQFVIVSYGDDFLGDLCGDLWIVSGDGNAFEIGTEESFGYYDLVSSYDYGTQVHVAINYAYGISAGGGYVFGYKDGKVTEYTKGLANFGNKELTEDGRLIRWAEAYTAFCDIFDGEEMWTGHTWLPYYYKFDGNTYKTLPIKTVEKNEIEKMGSFSDEEIQENEQISEYMLVGDDILMVNTVNESDNESKAYVVYSYHLNSDEKTWEYYEKRMGFYEDYNISFD